MLNHGSATGADPAEAATMMTADVGDDVEDAGDVEVTVHEVRGGEWPAG